MSGNKIHPDPPQAAAGQDAGSLWHSNLPPTASYQDGPAVEEGFYTDAASHISAQPSQASRGSGRASFRSLLHFPRGRRSESNRSLKTGQTHMSVKEELAMEEQLKDDPSHILDTILEEDSSDEAVAVGQAATQLNIEDHPIDDTTRTPNDTAAALKRKGFRENLERRKRLERFTRSSKILESFRTLYTDYLSRTLITRLFCWWLPLALILFIPLAVGAWQNPDMRLGGTRVMWIFIWLEVVWGSLLIARVFARYIPELLGAIVAVIMPRYFKFVDLAVSLERAVTLVIWTFVSFISFSPLLYDNKDALEKEKNGGAMPKWQKIIQDILVAFLVSSLIYFCEQVFIHLLSVDFHRARMSIRIAHSKKAIQVLTVLLGLAYHFFPYGCDEFEDEDTMLASTTLQNVHQKTSKFTSKFKPLQAINNFVSSSVGATNQMLRTGTPSLSGTVKDALASKMGSEVLACRIWKSLVMEDSDALTYQELLDTLGKERQEEVLFMFEVLDLDGGSSIDLEEMINSCKAIGKERKDISKSLVDMDGAITKLNYFLLFMCLIIVVIIFVGMLAPSGAAVLATLGSTILSLSFLFSSAASEVFNACIFLFVKHPYDVGDWVKISVAGAGFSRMQVKKMALLYTTFAEVGTNIVRQCSNSVLNTIFIDNLSRSDGSQASAILTLGLPETKMQDIEELEKRLALFLDANPREYLPGTFVQISDQTDLDRISLTVCANTRCSQDDIVIFSNRCTKFYNFLSRCINEIPLHVPRRDDTSTDPALPVYQVNLQQDEGRIKPIDDPRMVGKRRRLGFLPDPDVDSEPTEQQVGDTEQETNNISRAPSFARSFSTMASRASNTHGLRRTRASKLF